MQAQQKQHDRVPDKPAPRGMSRDESGALAHGSANSVLLQA
jgi:hypothetical protein